MVAAFFSFVWRALDGLRKVLHLIVLLVMFTLVFAAFVGPLRGVGLNPNIPNEAVGPIDPRTGFPPNVAVQFEIKLLSVK